MAAPSPTLERQSPERQVTVATLEIQKRNLNAISEARNYLAIDRFAMGLSSSDSKTRNYAKGVILEMVLDTRSVGNANAIEVLKKTIRNGNPQGIETVNQIATDATAKLEQQHTDLGRDIVILKGISSDAKERLPKNTNLKNDLRREWNL